MEEYDALVREWQSGALKWWIMQREWFTMACHTCKLLVKRRRPAE